MCDDRKSFLQHGAWNNFLMKSKIEIIAYSLIAVLKDILKVSGEEIKSESFKLTFDLNRYSISLLCSLHHLDMPWKISLVVKNRSEDFELSFKTDRSTKEYEITPIFLADVNANSQILAGKIKADVIDIIKGLQEV